LLCSHRRLISGTPSFFFPGAKVPFVVRPKLQIYFEGEEMHPGLPQMTSKFSFMSGKENVVSREFIGECWINDFKDMVGDATTLDYIFLVE
jgi:hypothetical protein